MIKCFNLILINIYVYVNIFFVGIGMASLNVPNRDSRLVQNCPLSDYSIRKLWSTSHSFLHGNLGMLSIVWIDFIPIMKTKINSGVKTLWHPQFIKNRVIFMEDHIIYYKVDRLWNGLYWMWSSMKITSMQIQISKLIPPSFYIKILICQYPAILQKAMEELTISK